MNEAVMFSRASDEWTTPREFFDALHAEFDFVVDIAATDDNKLCRAYVGPDHQWGGQWRDYLLFDLPALMRGVRGAAWMNPPYSQCRAFINKAFADSRKGCTVVALVPSRTDTYWWHTWVWDGEKNRPREGVEVRFVRGRLKFGDGKNSAPFPSVVIVFRPVETPA